MVYFEDLDDSTRGHLGAATPFVEHVTTPFVEHVTTPFVEHVTTPFVEHVPRISGTTWRGLDGCRRDSRKATPHEPVAVRVDLILNENSPDI